MPNTRNMTLSLNDCVAQLQELKRTISCGLLKVGAILSHIKVNKVYEPDYPSLEAFIAIPELSFSRSTAYKAMRIYEIFVEKFALGKEVADIDPDKLYKISGIVENDNVEEWIEKARCLSRSDLNAEINELKGKPMPPTTEELIDEFLSQNTEIRDAKTLLLKWERFKQDKREGFHG